MRHHTSGHPVRSRWSARLLAILLGTAALLGTQVQPAQASCMVGIIGRSTMMNMGFRLQNIATAGTVLSYSLMRLSDALTRYSNNMTQSTQSRNTARANQADARTAQMSQQAIGEARAKLAEDFSPSVNVCNDVSAQRRLGATGVQYAAYRTALQTRNTGYSTNAPGSGSERGTLGSLATVWNERCTRYANPATMNPPPGVNCPGPGDATLRDLDVQPWRALIDPVQFTSPQRVQAAEDAIRMLTELTAPDPVRGAVLGRDQGRILHVLRMRDVTRMNLVRGVLEDVAAMRRVDTASGQTHSRLARYLELVTGRTWDVAQNRLTDTPTATTDTTVSKEGENAALQLVATRVATQQGMMFEIMRVAEELVALEAVELAMKVERTRVGGTTAAGRVMQSQ